MYLIRCTSSGHHHHHCRHHRCRSHHPYHHMINHPHQPLDQVITPVPSLFHHQFFAYSLLNHHCFIVMYKINLIITRYSRLSSQHVDCTLRLPSRDFTVAIVVKVQFIIYTFTSGVKSAHRIPTASLLTFVPVRPARGSLPRGSSLQGYT